MADNEGRGKRKKKRTKHYDENSDDESESKADDDADAKRRRRGVDATSPPSNNISSITQHRPSAVDVSADNNAAVSSLEASAAQPSETEGKAEESASSDPIFCEVCGGEHGTNICPFCATCFARDEGCVKRENCKCNEKPAAVAVGAPPNNNATTIAIASTSTTITHASDSAVSSTAVSSISVLPSGDPSISTTSTCASSTSAISNRTVPKLCQPPPQPNLPAGKHKSSYNKFTNLPADDSCCVEIDILLGLWYVCKYCGKVYAKKLSPFTVGRWNEHKNYEKHTTAVKNADALEKLKLKEKEKGGTMSSLDKSRLKGLKFTASTMMTNYFGKAKAGKASSTKPIAKFTTPKPKMCEGLLKDYGKGSVQPKLAAFGMYCAVNSNSSYKVGTVGDSNNTYTTIFSKECVRGAGSSIMGFRQCDSCKQYR